MIVELAAAIQFLLISPALIKRAFTPGELGRSTAFFPLVGLLLGAVLAASDAALAYIFPIQVRSALVLGLWILLTGALHFDGFLDACDGLLGGADVEDRLRIMRDERTGAYALAGGALLLLTMYSALNALESTRWQALLLAPVVGRCAITLSVVTYPYARATGLGREIKDNAGPVQAVAALVATLAVAAALGWWSHSLREVMAVAAAASVWRLASSYTLRRIPGMTGDTYGAINMLIEATVLLTFAAGR